MSGDESRPIPLGMTGKVLYKVDGYVGKMAAHGFYPDQGVNAVEDAGKIMWRPSTNSTSVITHPTYGSRELFHA